MNILQIVIKNTSTMDFSVPVLCDIAQQRNDVNITILYCVLDRRNILRKASFWDRVFDSNNIVQVDFCNYLKPHWRFLEGFFRLLFSGAMADKIHFHEAWKFYKYNTTAPGVIGFIRFLINEYSFSGLLKNLMQSALTQLEKLGTMTFVNLPMILPSIDPDFILFDNRSVTNFPGRDDIYSWMYQHKRRVGLLPHAPHLRDPVREFCPFDEKGDSLPDFCEFWSPLKFGTPWVSIPERRDQFYFTGYPGLDSDWLALCREGMDKKRSKRQPGEPLRCLFVMRRYLPKGSIRPEGTDPYIVDYDDFANPLISTVHAFAKLNQDVKLILKPHPANNYNVLKRDLTRLGIKDYEISHDSIYPLLSKVDLVVGIFSTILLVPAMAGIRTILISTKLQDTVNTEWPLLGTMYKRLTGFSCNNFELENNIRFAIDSLVDSSNNSDAKQLREYFDDGAKYKVAQRIFAGEHAHKQGVI